MLKTCKTHEVLMYIVKCMNLTYTKWPEYIIITDAGMLKFKLMPTFWQHEWNALTQSCNGQEQELVNYLPLSSLFFKSVEWNKTISVLDSIFCSTTSLFKRKLSSVREPVVWAKNCPSPKWWKTQFIIKPNWRFDNSVQDTVARTSSFKTYRVRTGLSMGSKIITT